MKQQQQKIKDQLQELNQQQNKISEQIGNLIKTKNNVPVYDQETFKKIEDVSQKQKEIKQKIKEVQTEKQQLQETLKEGDKFKYKSTEEITNEISKLEKQLESDSNQDESEITKKIKELQEIKIKFISSRKHKAGNQQKAKDLDNEYDKLRKTLRDNTKVLDELFKKWDESDAQYQKQLKNLNIEQIDKQIQELRQKRDQLKEKQTQLKQQMQDVYVQFQEDQKKKQELKKQLDKFYDNKFKVNRLQNDEYEVLKPRLMKDKDKDMRNKFIEVLKEMDKEIQEEEKEKDRVEVQEINKKKQVFLYLQDEEENPIFQEMGVSKAQMKNKEARDKKIQELESQDKTEEYQKQYDERCELLNKLVEQYKALGGKIVIKE